jgi:cullin family protein
MHLYTKICGLFTPKSEAYPKIAAMYAHLDSHLQLRCGEIGAEMEQSCETDDVFEVYTSHWARFQGAARQIDRLFSYTNRHWVKNEQYQPKIVCDAYTLHMNNWREFALEPVRVRITEALIQRIQSHRGGQDIDLALIKDVLSSLCKYST